MAAHKLVLYIVIVTHNVALINLFAVLVKHPGELPYGLPVHDELYRRIFAQIVSGLGYVARLSLAVIVAVEPLARVDIPAAKFNYSIFHISCFCGGL